MQILKMTEFLNEFNLSTDTVSRPSRGASPRCSAAWPLWRPHWAWTRGDRRPVLEKMTFDPSSPHPRLWFWDRHRAQAFSTHVGIRGVVRVRGRGELRSSGHGRQHA